VTIGNAFLGDGKQTQDLEEREDAWIAEPPAGRYSAGGGAPWSGYVAQTDGRHAAA
jgi:hypothetical protein